MAARWPSISKHQKHFSGERGGGGTSGEEREGRELVPEKAARHGAEGEVSLRAQERREQREKGEKGEMRVVRCRRGVRALTALSADRGGKPADPKRENRAARMGLTHGFNCAADVRHCLVDERPLRRWSWNLVKLNKGWSSPRLTPIPKLILGQGRESD
ncbi:hypothetical protein ACLOJK_004419 [Asimina triloba]